MYPAIEEEHWQSQWRPKKFFQIEGYHVRGSRVLEPVSRSNKREVLLVRFTHPAAVAQRTIAGFAASVLVQAVLVALTTAVLVLLVRRLFGAIHDPLDGRVLSLLGMGFVSSAIAMCLVTPKRELRLNRVARPILPALLLLIAVALTVPGTNPWALTLLWACVVASVGLLARPTLLTRMTIRSLPGRTAPTSNARDSQLIARQTLARAADEVWVVRGSLLVEFQPGERTAVKHIAFCPQFAEPPTMKLSLRHPSRFGDARIKISQTLVQGVRFELKLAEAAEIVTSVMIDFEAVGRGR